MIALPSIAFDGFSGSAKDVTARNVAGRTILSVKSYSKQIASPLQVARRTSLAKVSRAYKQLTDSQMKAWETLAERMKSASVFGQYADLTGHNAFVRLNTQLQMAGVSLLCDAPSTLSAVPNVRYDDFWVKTDRIIFVGIEQPETKYKLVMKMSAGQSSGVSNAWGKTVIISPSLIPDWGDVDVLEIYTEKFGLSPEYGKKYFIEMYWMDTETGFTGESVRVSAICQDLSLVHKQPYTPRPTFNSDQVGTSESLPSFDFEMEGGSGIFNVNVDYQGKDGEASASVDFDKLPENIPSFDSYVMGRNGEGKYKDYGYCPQTFVVWCRQYSSDGSLTFAHRGGNYEKPLEIFGSGIMIKRNN